MIGAVIYGYLINPRENPNERNRRIACASHLKQIVISLQQYADDFEGHFPDKNGAEGFQMLINQEYLTDKRIYICPNDKARQQAYIDNDNKLTEEDVSYVYKAGLNKDASPETQIVWEKQNYHGKYRNILHVKGFVKGEKVK